MDEQRYEFGGRAVTQLLIDRAGFRFLCSTIDGDLDVRFATPFSFQAPDRRELDVDPQEPQDLVPLLDLIRTGVSLIRIHRSGEIAITFSDGSSIRSWPHPAYEAWQIDGAGELSEIAYLCGPGGGSPWG